MSRLSRVTETGIQHVVVGRVRRWLRVLRDDLWTFRADPLPPSLWLRWLPHGLLCLIAFGVTVAGTPQLEERVGLAFGWAFPLSLAHGCAVLLGMWRPIPAFWLSTVASLLAALLVHGKLGGPAGGFTWPWSTTGIITHVVVLLLLALRVRARVPTEALALTALVTYVLQGLWGGPDYSSTGVLTLSLCSVSVVLGAALRGRREARAELVEQTSLTAEERARRTVLEERSRIARELHDVVAHHMSVISIQAQVAPHLVENPSDELKENLEGIRENALEALTELRRVLGVLRSEHPDTPDQVGAPGTDTGTAPHTPQPTLDRLDALVENTRAAGLTVRVDVQGTRGQLPQGVELSAYRIVQEALSNVLRHAPGATAAVRLVHHKHGVDVRVTNSPPTGRVPLSRGAGHGLLGMRERAAMLGGTLRAGPGPDGGFEVAAFLPTSPPWAEAPAVGSASAPSPDPKDGPV
ncbi:sensor histidine kinase [Streptomyces justiciae]|uniref:sensor histidine kinase n=1 Tax=Streptomyces justiciae TaxID=2780140 RepID=UPI001881EE67|nr:sensor histidine kinase [Streptomyces justiciae]MBE8471181.1 sensor histidine kinase [Streptomyces justiciae]